MRALYLLTKSRPCSVNKRTGPARLVVATGCRTRGCRGFTARCAGRRSHAGDGCSRAGRADRLAPPRSSWGRLDVPPDSRGPPGHLAGERDDHRLRRWRDPRLDRRARAQRRGAGLGRVAPV